MTPEGMLAILDAEYPYFRNLNRDLRMLVLCQEVVKDAVNEEVNEQLIAHSECIETAVIGAIAYEREACAKVVEYIYSQIGGCCTDEHDIAQAIRDRK